MEVGSMDKAQCFHAAVVQTVTDNSGPKHSSSVFDERADFFLLLKADKPARLFPVFEENQRRNPLYIEAAGRRRIVVPIQLQYRRILLILLRDRLQHRS